ncbi:MULTISPECIES: DUF1493 family protein [Enterobacter]|uniref:DUF1493 family protein n=1 Tax=Enterobacter TaxID=547 RepID=UPI000267FDA4|nr:MULTISPECIES: DUF1493 family protein [Enterobacter]AFM58297.1 putative phage-associated acyl carrier protein [Enterobacter cloacae subsp. dissolvens SDM]RTQ02648.1 DUF1493 family protein [Enterobacter sp. WCHEn045836]
MVEDIEQRIYALARRYNGVYLMNNEAKQKLLNAKTDLDTDMQLDVTEAEDLMEEFFKEFDVDRGNFNIITYYPDEPFSLNPFEKFPVVMVPDFTIGMLIESAKAGKWLYD